MNVLNTSLQEGNINDSANPDLSFRRYSEEEKLINEQASAGENILNFKQEVQEKKEKRSSKQGKESISIEMMVFINNFNN